ncbi:hypothetical protein LRR18_01215 [Mangrovimonas sp. AS39]|uniref:hypothetical protein n=1 Tax=Mangrovimonas futianensis TaxID=2895523 RepID=UPI001E45F6A7|nr:hypothetical protein [Mangrovimonas futianensis]MCF1190186.1 hypothetical protein [Mangrovimonas futianensis]MCF1194063.1 hypothetical protein [Mangrovimonas futianensis]
MSKLPITDISNLIPQKSPFVMVNSLEHFSETEVVSTFTITEDNIFVENGQLQEPGLVENMAQTVALHTGYAYFLKGEDAPTGYIGSIKKIAVKKLPSIKETITTKVSILHEIMGVTMVNVTVLNVDQEEIASGEMKTVIADNG